MICFPRCNCFSKKKHLFRVNLPTLPLSPFRIEHVFWHQQVFNSWGTIASVFLTTVDSLVEKMSVISAGSRIKYCIIDNPDIKTSHGPPLAPQSSQSSQSAPTFTFWLLQLNIKGNTESGWRVCRQSWTGRRQQWTLCSAGRLWIICSFARSVVLWPETAHCRLYCGRNLVFGGF